MTITTRWVHGNIVQPENPVEFVIRRGWGTHFGVRSTERNWFHFPLSNLAMVNNVRQRVCSVYVLYRTDSAIIREVDVYDGPLRIKAFEDLALQGDHVGKINNSNHWLIYPPIEISYGLGISVEVEFSLEEGIGIADMLFAAAGAEFDIT